MLLDDHAVVLKGLRTWLASQADLKILGAFSNSHDLLQALSVNSPDILLIDYSLSEDDVDGLSLVRRLALHNPKSKILVLSSHNAPSTVAMVLRNGAHGFVGKDVGDDTIIHAIHSVASGQQYIESRLAEKLKTLHNSSKTIISDFDSSTAAIENDPQQELNHWLTSAKLTPREWEVIRCCLQGLSVTQIAQKFSRSIKTISAQKSTAFRKLGIHCNNELFRNAELIFRHPKK